jgi:hypothetical protein
MEKLIEMMNSGVNVSVWGNEIYKNQWHICAKKELDGVAFAVTVTNPHLEYAIEEVYSKWIGGTRGLPAHSLNQIDYIPPAAPIDLNDEIPF